jgi:hypothetical protein
MKACRFLVFLALIIGLMAGPWQAPAEAAGMLGRVGQIQNLYYSSGNWYQTLPDGTTQAFILATGQTFIMTGAYVRFYATTTDTGPYRFLLKAPNGTQLWFENLNNITYPTTGATVYGGAASEILEPGIPISVSPTVEVRQLPQPPANPNTGTVIDGTFYMRVTGYIVP